MKLSIIIPNFNGARFLGPCLDSLRNQTFQDFQVLLADNGSSDSSLSFVSSHYPEVLILLSPRNQGFAAAANAGIRYARTPYVMLLNNDTILAPSCLAHLMEAIQQDPRAFSVGAKILTMDEPPLVDTTGDFYSLFGYAFCRGQGDKPGPRNLRPVFTNSGCAVIYRRSLLGRTGLLDPRFFAYLEDVDLGFRARIRGLTNIHCPSAIVFHVGSGTTGAKYTPLKVFCSARNNLWLRQKNLTLFQKICHLPLFVLGSFVKYLYFRRHGLHTWYLRGILAGLRHPVLPGRELSFVSFLRTEPWILLGTFLYAAQYLRRKLTS